jgi:hypothetical protein
LNLRSSELSGKYLGGIIENSFIFLLRELEASLDKIDSLETFPSAEIESTLKRSLFPFSFLLIGVLPSLFS